MNLRIGTSGWSYPTGQGAWSGVFYPARRGRGKFDELAYYAEHFDTVEVNASFYGVPRPETSRNWATRTPAGFEFSLKLYQKFTHPEMFRKASGKQDLSIGAGDVDQFRRGIEPLARIGKLGALLAQFPPSFKSSEASRDYLAWLLNVLHDYPVAVELRHRSWSDHLTDTLTLLNGCGAAWTQIDEPKFQFSIQQNYLPNVTGFYYMRLHGRNAARWWAHDKTEDRYDYLYTREELQPFIDTADAARRLVRKMYLYMNNHFAGKSVANAVMLKHSLGLKVSGAYSPEFVERYPELANVVTVAPPDSILAPVRSPMP